MIFYVYCLISKSNPKFHYYGFTADIDARLSAHKSGKVRTTHRFAPVELLGFREFDNEFEARQFEKDLKSKASYRKKFIADLAEAHLPA